MGDELAEDDIFSAAARGDLTSVKYFIERERVLDRSTLPRPEDIPLQWRDMFLAGQRSATFTENPFTYPRPDHPTRRPSNPELAVLSELTVASPGAPRCGRRGGAGGSRTPRWPRHTDIRLSAMRIE